MSDKKGYRKLLNSEMERKSLEEFRDFRKIPLVVVLDNVRSLHNVGSVFRTCDAFLVEELILCGITGQPPHAEIRKTALGASESVKWSYFRDTKEAVSSLREDSYILLAGEQTEHSICLSNFEPDLNRKYALFLGNEVKGVQQEVLDNMDGVLEIPQEGTKHSLNISVSAGVFIWHFYRSFSG
ncbi:MAG: RNA methyltransferase [Bacteroidia bacterium]|nr:MAG: RNA methyltransferase [Bacteroidia bacterium]